MRRSLEEGFPHPWSTGTGSTIWSWGCLSVPASPTCVGHSPAQQGGVGASTSLGCSPASSTLPRHRTETSCPMGETPGWENSAEPQHLPRALPKLPLGAGGSAPASAACASAAACQGGLSGSARSSPEPRRDLKT